MCIGRGPEWDADDHGYKSNLVIATKQFERAQSLWSGNATTVQGTSIFHSHVPPNLCHAALQSCIYVVRGKQHVFRSQCGSILL